MKLGFIGGGVMAEAIIAGVRRANLDAEITVGEPVEERRATLVSTYGVTGVAENKAAIDGTDLIVLAVKPQQLDGVAEAIGGSLTSDQTVLSILAGVKMHTLGTKLNHGRLIRVMPNTPAQVGEGMSAWHASPDVPDAVREFASQMLDALGDRGLRHSS